MIHDPTLRSAARRLIVVQAIGWTGRGVMMSVSAIYFTGTLEFDVRDFGIVLSVAGVCGVLSSLLAGWACDRWDPRLVSVAAAMVEGLGLTCLAAVSSLRWH